MTPEEKAVLDAALTNDLNNVGSKLRAAMEAYRHTHKRYSVERYVHNSGECHCQSTSEWCVRKDGNYFICRSWDKGQIADICDLLNGDD